MKDGINTSGQDMNSGGVALYSEQRDEVSHFAFQTLTQERKHLRMLDGIICYVLCRRGRGGNQQGRRNNSEHDFEACLAHTFHTIL